MNRVRYSERDIFDSMKRIPKPNLKRWRDVTSKLKCPEGYLWVSWLDEKEVTGVRC